MSDQGTLAARFLSRGGRNEDEASRLAVPLQVALDEAHRAWPSIELAEETFIDHLATRLRPEDDPVGLLAQLSISDLYLACAAERGRTDAVHALENLFLCRIGQFIAHISRNPEFIDEVTQAIRVKMFVGKDGQGKLSQYSGRGPLDSWLCAVAIRTAYDIVRAQGRKVEQPDDTVDVLAASDDPELEALRHRYDAHFRSALEAALANLARRDRTILRLYYMERLTAAQVAKLYRVHEVTVLRWIAAARRTILEWVRADLSRTLGISTEEFNELLTLLRSKLDVSVGRLLESQKERLSTAASDSHNRQTPKKRTE